MRLLLVAYPGAGKGTQAKRLAEHYGITHISSGALLRDEVGRGTSIGRDAAHYLEHGDLVPDAVVFEIVWPRIVEAAHNGGYVLDGFPRTLGQGKEAYSRARALEDVTLQAVIHLRVSEEELHRRLRARADTEGRNDDTEATIARRFAVFDAQTRPLLGLYAGRSLLVEVNGEPPAEDVFVDIKRAISGLQHLVGVNGERR